MRKPNYDKFPFVEVSGNPDNCVAGWEAICARLRQEISRTNRAKTVITVECYPGVDETAVLSGLALHLRPELVIKAREAMKSPDEVEALVAPFLGGNDPVFGFLSGLTLPQFFNEQRLDSMKRQSAQAANGIILVVGCGASQIARGDIFIYADLARWEAQKRFRRNESANLGTDNHHLAASLQYKRAFFIDWRVADRWKRPLIASWDFVLDTHDPKQPLLAEGEAVRRGLREAVSRPFRVVPFFDPAPWGGQWMKKVCDLDAGVPNYGWCFDCVPEENSLFLGFGAHRFEIPSLDLVFHQPRALLGEKVHARFGDEFPIRFDFLDTIDGGNLSFQVHPLTEYIQNAFGMHYTQDESYYILDAGTDATIYLGCKEGVDPIAITTALELAQKGNAPFDADAYACRWSAQKHDHFLIPAGTVHCSGKNAMVLEISATPYIFTFKLWDWARLGLDGKPRPIHLAHGLANIQWERTEAWVKRHLINRFEPLAAGDGWREERTGLHEREFIETRRHWFSKPVRHDTSGGVNVLNLIQGHEAVVESPDRAFSPFKVHYAETFIVPAAVGPYVISPVTKTGEELGTLKAFVRT
jgi:mannose-6-phosphate isomerase class I